MTATSECLRNLEIEIPAGEVEREYTRIAQGIQRRARIPGFRPGKAPLSLVRQHFNAKIREELVETLVPAHLRAAFERESLEPVSTPSLDELAFEPGAPLKFKASFEVIPGFELGDYRSIRVTMPAVEVNVAEVDAALEALRERQSTREPSEAAEAAPGLVAQVEATVLPETEAGDQNEAPAPPQELSIEVGANDTMPEFSTALSGMRVGEERDLEVAYPAEYPNAGLAGKTRKYHLKLTGIQRKVMPELTDAFVQEATGAGTVTELRERIERNLQAEREQQARRQAEESVVDQMIQQTPVVLPESLVKKEIDARMERNIRGLAEQGIDPRKLQLDWGKLRSSQEEAARRHVHAGLVLEKIAEREHIEAPPEAVEETLRVTAEELKQPLEGLRARLTDNGVLDRIKNRIRLEKTMDFLVQSATGEGTEKSS